MSRRDRQPPFFTIGGRLFVDLTFNFDDAPIRPTPAELAQLLARVPADDLVIGRALAAKEQVFVERMLGDVAAEAFGLLLTSDASRWRGLRRRRRGHR